MERIVVELTGRDRQMLKDDRRVGFVFFAIIISFGALFNLSYFVLNIAERDCMIITLIDLGVVLLACTVYYLVNRKTNRDLKCNTKGLIKKRVERKSEEIDYEAGSGTLYVPVLGDLFPKLWGDKMRELPKYYIFTDYAKY